MPVHNPAVPPALSGIALVNRDPALRRARQLMLRSERFEVRAYATGVALLGDPLALRCACMIADVEMSDLSGVQLLKAMRATGWTGAAILLADVVPIEHVTATNDHTVTTMLPRTLSDGALLKAVRTALA